MYIRQLQGPEEIGRWKRKDQELQPDQEVGTIAITRSITIIGIAETPTRRLVGVSFFIRRNKLVDCKYPHRVTIALTEKAYTDLNKELYVRHVMGDVVPSIANVVLLSILSRIQENDTTPIYLDTEDVKKSDHPTIRTIVPCKECHEYPCTCELEGPCDV